LLKQSRYFLETFRLHLNTVVISDSPKGVAHMNRLNRIVAGFSASVLLALGVGAPANAIVDQNGRVVGIIITEDGSTYY
jgi:hypothetical protein